MTAEESPDDIRRRMITEFPYYAPRALKIRPKAGGTVVPFRMNRAQEYVHERLEAQRSELGLVRALILKGRQQGISTYVGGRFFHRVTLNPGRWAFILTHEAKATTNLFRMTQRYWLNAPPICRPALKASNAQELVLDQLGSGYALGTAKSGDTGRSLNVHLFHGSEVAFWDNADEHMAAIGQALPLMEGTESILESTANGLGDWWHSTWVRATKGESDYLPIFVPWFWQQEYRLTVPADFALTQAEVELAELYDLHPEQIAWRRYKIRTDLRGDVSLFQREYPCTPSEAFLHGAEGGFIEPPLVVSGRKPKMLRPLGAKVMGVDPADGGADETAIAIRQGKYLHPLQTLRRAQSMEVVGRVAELIDRHKPDVTFIDQGQGGQGSSIIQRLHELNYRNVVGVLFGGTADEPDLYVRKGDEMWGRMKEWLQDGPVVLPDDDVLEGQLTSRTYTHDSSRRLRMEPKEKLKERGLSSPDRADALALTFAFPVRPRSDESSDDRARRAAWWNA